MLSIDTVSELESCRRFRDFLLPRFGFDDELRVVFAARGLTWGALAIHHAGSEPAFIADEAQVAALVRIRSPNSSSEPSSNRSLPHRKRR
ncbi:MAG: hypothetical protein JO057_12740 [Chloroflexi bacterium]|nr:hypothetical protein [Chloroflexota bacterium]